jgi:hypothetical protein
MAKRQGVRHVKKLLTCRDDVPPVAKQNLTHPVSHVERGKPVYLSVKWQSKFVVKHTDGHAGMGGWKKQMPFCNGRDKGCTLLRKQADFHLVLCYEKIVVRFKFRKANESEKMCT